jgi:predicted MPP superfamily phosphohydrolase
MDPRLRRALSGAVVLALALLGAFIGALLAPSAHARIGPLTVSVQIRPSLHPGSQVQLAPFGSVHFNTHEAPVAVNASIQTVDADQAQEVLQSAASLQDLEQKAPDRLRAAVIRAAMFTAICALVGAGLLGAIGLRTIRGTAEALALALAVVVGVSSAAVVTFDEDSLASPRFSGLLDRAPYVVGQTQGLVKRLESYRSGLADFVDSVTALYAVGARLPDSAPGSAGGNVITVLHISDIHDNPLGFDLTARLAKQFSVDAVIDTGDVTTNGTPLEATQLARIGQLGVPYVFVRGNHDSASTQAAVASEKNAVVLDDRVATVAGLTIAGIGDPRFTPVEGSAAPDRPEAVAADTQLAGTIRTYDAAHPDDPVDLALVHDPSAADPLAGTVPLVLAGHLHKREVRTVGPTTILVEGTTGGALITSDGLVKAGEGQALPLDASLLYFSRSGPDRGRLLAYDEVTVGGLGLTSVSITRTVLRPGEIGIPGQLPTPSPSGSSGLPTTPGATPGAGVPSGSSSG